MAITSTISGGTDRVKMATGSHFDDAGTDAASIALGFTPRYIFVENETDRIRFEWFEGMTSAYCVKTVAAGTRTLETSAGITILGSNRGFSFPVLTDKQYRWNATD